MTSRPSREGVLWLRPRPRRPILNAHLRQIRGRFRAAGWRVVSGDAPPETVDGPLAVLDDVWLEPLPAAAELLARASAPAGVTAGRSTRRRGELPARSRMPAGRWRVPRIRGAPPPQGWTPADGPYTLRDYERVATAGRRGRGTDAGPDPDLGFAVAAAGDAATLLDAGWPPAPETVVLVPEARVFRYDDPAGHDRRELDPFLPSEFRTLVDVGCGHGRLGARHRRPGRIVAGIEPDPRLAGEAARRLDLVLSVRAEEGLRALRPGLDCLVFADVLEHTSDPRAILEQAARVLAPDGRIVVSLPNAAWAPVVRALAAGRWDPTLAGPQAHDHLVPMTARSFRRQAAECGLVVETLEPLVAPLSWRLRLWARLAARTAGGDVRDLLAAQWIAVLRSA